MNRFEKIGLRVASSTVMDQLRGKIPSDVFNVLRNAPLIEQKDFLNAILEHSKIKLKIAEYHSGDDARSGDESGMLISVNDRIIPKYETDPGKTMIIKSPRKWNIGRGNMISMSRYIKSWIPLD